MTKRLRYILAGLGLAILLSSCASYSGEIARAPRFHKGSPVVYIHPVTDVYQDAGLGILPFQVPANISEDKGLTVAALFKDVMLGKRAFPSIRLIDTPYGDLEDAIERGEKAGVDLVLAGIVNHVMTGAELGGARVDISIRLINVHTGNTVWYIGQIMSRPVDYPDVGMPARLYRALGTPAIKPPLANPMIPNMLQQIAEDMTDVVGGVRYVHR